jgi:4-amino-4-deoxy-L-arabinose transferase-like glycosyltransferase
MRRWLLPLILFLAFLLRVYNLSDFPSGFTPDEASFGYDAYSILLTGKDQWGKTLPLLLESFGDFKSPLLAYLAIPFIGLGSLTKEMVRLPNAILSTLSVFVVYLLAGELGKLGKLKKQDINLLQIISVVFVAFSPWHIMMSRGAFEANLTTFFMPAGVLFFVRGLKNKRDTIISFILFTLNLFTYHSAKLVTPLIVLFLLTIFMKKLKEGGINKLLPGLIVFGVGLLLTFYTLFQGGAARAKDISITNGAMQEAATGRLTAINAGIPFAIAKFTNNKFTIIAKRFVENYTQYSSYKFLFTDGPAEATYGMIPGRGVLYGFEIILLLFFLYSLFIFKNKKPLFMLVFWLLIAPIPAALTMGKGFSANRAAIMMPALQMISAIGLFTIIYLVNKRYKKYRNALLAVFAIVFFISVFSFIRDYFFLSPLITSKQMLYGNLEAAQLLESKFNNEKKIVVSKKLSEPHIYIAFAQMLDPRIYQEQTKNWNYQELGVNWVDQMPEYELGRYVFKNIEWNIDSGSDNLLVGKPDEFPTSIEPLVQINYPNGESAILIVNPNIKNYAWKNN